MLNVGRRLESAYWREEKSIPSVLVAFARMIPWLLAGLSSHLCTRAGERVKVRMPVVGAERLPTCDPLSSEPLAPAASQALPEAYCSQVAADSTQGRSRS